MSFISLCRTHTSWVFCIHVKTQTTHPRPCLHYKQENTQEKTPRHKPFLQSHTCSIPRNLLSPKVTVHRQALLSLTRHLGSEASSVVWRAGRCWGPRGAGWGIRLRSVVIFLLVPPGAKGLRDWKGGTLLKNTCDNDVIWVLVRPAPQLLTVMM